MKLHTLNNSTMSQCRADHSPLSSPQRPLPSHVTNCLFQSEGFPVVGDFSKKKEKVVKGRQVPGTEFSFLISIDLF
jgi:hypothetical protein